MSEQQPDVLNTGVTLHIIEPQETGTEDGQYDYAISAASARGQVMLLGTVLPKKHFGPDEAQRRITQVVVFGGHETEAGGHKINFAHECDPPLTSRAERLAAIQQLAVYATHAILGGGPYAQEVQVSVNDAPLAEAAPPTQDVELPPTAP